MPSPVVYISRGWNLQAVYFLHSLYDIPAGDHVFFRHADRMPVHPVTEMMHVQEKS